MRWTKSTLAVCTAVLSLSVAGVALSAPQIPGPCLNPVTCVPPYDNVGTPDPAGYDDNGPDGTTQTFRNTLQCYDRDMITTLKSTYTNVPDSVPVETAQAAVAKYLSRATLPTGLSATDWSQVNLQRTDLTLFRTQSSGLEGPDFGRQRLLGEMLLSRVNRSWRVLTFSACGEYLYPGSVTIDEAAE